MSDQVLEFFAALERMASTPAALMGAIAAAVVILALILAVRWSLSGGR